jgi:hypothetical protein
MTAAPTTSRAPTVCCVRKYPSGSAQDHARHEQRLDDRDATPIECGSLQNDTDDLRDESEQPDPRRQQCQERRRVADTRCR